MLDSYHENEDIILLLFVQLQLLSTTGYNNWVSFRYPFDDTGHWIIGLLLLSPTSSQAITICSGRGIQRAIDTAATTKFSHRRGLCACLGSGSTHLPGACLKIWSIPSEFAQHLFFYSSLSVFSSVHCDPPSTLFATSSSVVWNHSHAGIDDRMNLYIRVLTLEALSLYCVFADSAIHYRCFPFERLGLVNDHQNEDC